MIGRVNTVVLALIGVVMACNTGTECCLDGGSGAVVWGNVTDSSGTLPVPATIRALALVRCESGEYDAYRPSAKEESNESGAYRLFIDLLLYAGSFCVELEAAAPAESGFGSVTVTVGPLEFTGPATDSIRVDFRLPRQE